MDKYAELRAALAAGPTSGPWRYEMVYDAGYAHINFDSREWNTLRGFCGEANAVYIAAANPDTIRALLAERDALIHDNSEYVSAANELATENQRLREALKCIARTRTKPGDDKAALLLASVTNLAFAALAQEQGENNDNQD